MFSGIIERDQWHEMDQGLRIGFYNVTFLANNLVVFNGFEYFKSTLI